jgi:hypothetical protein
LFDWSRWSGDRAAIGSRRDGSGFVGASALVGEPAAPLDSDAAPWLRPILKLAMFGVKMFF